MTAQIDDRKLFDCPALVALKVVSGKWKTRILWLLRARSYSFNDLRRTLPGVSAKVLSEQVQQLVDAGIIKRREVERDGVKYSDLSFSSYGRTLIPILDALGEWGHAHKDGTAKSD